MIYKQKKERKMRILVVRHGQTDWNVERRIQGKTDVPLNQKGIEQAYIAEQKLKEEKIDLCLSSPLKRARQTAEIINSEREIPLKLDDRLIEISYGKMEGKYSNEFGARTEFGNVVDGQLCEEAEASQDFMDRIFSCLEELKKLQVDTVLLVTHKEVCKAIDFYFNGLLEDKERKGREVANCEVICYEIE